MASVQAMSARSVWGGGVNPYGVSYVKLGMWLFILSDSLTFAAFLFSYGYLRVASDTWPTPFEFFPSIVVSTVMTFCLLSSSLTMVLAVNKAQKGESRQAIQWLIGTMVFGLAFLGLHINEWRELIGHGLTPLGNPWGDAMFGSTFFAITGMHMFHVLTGVIYISIVAIRVSRGKNFKDEVEVCGLFWHFVDLVWMFVFPLIYLLSVDMGGGH
jgi:cytochrome c oxidase subunit 3